jgi:flavin-dependent dehydrogenase
VKVVVVGGGLAGLTAATRLARRGIQVSVFEKNTYPAHKVCGEYVSNETRAFLTREGLFPEASDIPDIRSLRLTSVSGRSATVPLPLGGFGISRYAFDDHLFRKAREAGAQVFTHEEVTDIRFAGNGFQVTTTKRQLEADFALGAYGKRSKLEMKPPRSPYVGVKYHVLADQPNDLISLHNFPGGYCGISKVEGGRWNLCYLSTRENLRRAGSIPELERSFLFVNPHLKSLFLNSEFLLTRPETINEVSFVTKSPVRTHVLLAGDAAGMIAPLAGNGMAIGLHSGKLVSDLLINSIPITDRARLESDYARQWHRLFYWRLWRGRLLQRLFGFSAGSEAAVALLRSPGLARRIIRLTHGESF